MDTVVQRRDGRRRLRDDDNDDDVSCVSCAGVHEPRRDDALRRAGRLRRRLGAPALRRRRSAARPGPVVQGRQDALSLRTRITAGGVVVVVVVAAAVLLRLSAPSRRSAVAFHQVLTTGVLAPRRRSSEIPPRRTVGWVKSKMLCIGATYV